MIRLGGIVYRLHPLFVLLMVLSVFTNYFVEVVTLFTVVTIHELGHVAAAKGYGWRISRVELLPFGGVAEVEESANVPAREEMVVALCGPLQNVWMVCFAWAMGKAGWGDAAYWNYFLHANMMIGLFNLLPILPLDGGKLLLGVVSYWTSYHRALAGGIYASLTFSVAMILLALVHYPSGGIQLNVLLIGLFLFYTNWYSLKHLHYQFVRFLVSRERRSIRMAEAGKPPLPLLVPSDSPPLEVLRRFKREQHHLLYIVGQSGKVLQIWPEARLVRAYLSRIGPPGENRGRDGMIWTSLS